MKSRTIFVALATTLLVGLLATSCTPKDDNTPEEATLMLSTTSITFDNGAQNPSAPQVTVTTNQAKWTATAPAEWLHVTQQGNGLLISALANKMGKDRSSDILVLAGGVFEKITVTQSAADIVLDVTPKELNVPNIGGEYRIDVRSNTETWEIEIDGDKDWVTISEQYSDFAKITVKPNEAEESRTVQLFARSGSTVKEITINQVGTSSRKYVLPLLDMVPSLNDVIEYENAQGSHLLDYTAPNPSWGQYDETLNFTCSAENMYQTVYKYNSQKGMVLNSIMQISDNAKAILSDDYKNFIKKYGFEIQETNENGFVAKNAETLFVIDVRSAGDIAVITFMGELKQDKEYKTFDKFPYDRSDWIDNMSMTIEKMKAAEESDGGKVEAIEDPDHPGVIRMLRVEVAAKYSPLHTRVLHAGENEDGTYADFLGEELAVWSELNLGAWDAKGTFLLTNEFKELLEKEGFEYWTKSQDGNDFYKKAIEGGYLVILPRGVQFSDLLDGKPVFSMNYFKVKENVNSFTDPILKQKLVDRISAKVQKTDKEFGKIK